MTATDQVRVTRPALRYFGGKWRLSRWIIDHIKTADHDAYTEAYGGAASVLLNKPRVRAEVYNDLDGEIVNLFQVLRNRGHHLQRMLALTPYARVEFENSFEPADDELEQARRTVIRSFMGFGSTFTRLTVTGRLMKTGFRDYSKKGRRTTPAQDWVSYAEALPSLVERLQGVIIENRPALQVLQKHDSAGTLHYVDPTYPHDSRGRPDGYRHEMTMPDHVALVKVLRGLSGYVVVSGYWTEPYKSLLADWRIEQRRAFADGARERMEILWLNY